MNPGEIHEPFRPDPDFLILHTLRCIGAAGVSAVVTGCYERFLVLNPKLLQISTDWQIRRFGTSQIINDHSDPEYDNKVLTRLIRLDDKAQPICAELTSRLLRFSPYADRLSRALDRSIAGESAYVSDNLDSYHTVWFQLHEDLLRTLGISREEKCRRNSD